METPPVKKTFAQRVVNNLQRLQKGSIIVQILVYITFSVFWIAELVLMKSHLKEFTFTSFALVVLRPSILPPRRREAWAIVHSIILTLLSLAVIGFKLTDEKMQLLDQFPNCGPMRLMLRFLKIDNSNDLKSDIFELLLIHLPLNVLVFLLPRNPEQIFKLPRKIDLSSPFIHFIEGFNCILWLLAVGCVFPSVLNSVYFCSAIIFGLAWSWSLSYATEKTFRYLLRFITIYILIHFSCVLFYQYPPFILSMPANSTLLRVTGIPQLYPAWCMPEYYTKEDDTVHPMSTQIIVCTCSLIFAIRSYLSRNEPQQDKKEPEHLSAESTKVTSVSNDFETEDKKEDEIIEETSMETDKSVNEMIVVNSVKTSPNNEMAMRRRRQGICIDRRPKRKTEPDDVDVEVLVLGTIINTIMMMWSVTFLSWLGFIMFMGSNAMWMVPRQNKAMRRASRLLTLYVTILLLNTYIFCMDYQWTSLFRKQSLLQIGLIYEDFSTVLHLFIKICFSIVVMMVQRQFTTPFIYSLRVPVSGFKDIMGVLNVVWSRWAILLSIFILLHYDVYAYKIYGAPLTLGLIVALMSVSLHLTSVDTHNYDLYCYIIPSYYRLGLKVFFVGMLILNIVKLTFTYLYQLEDAEYLISQIPGINHNIMVKSLGLRIHKGSKKRLLMNLWLHAVIAATTAIFLTVFASETYIIIERSWLRWRNRVIELVLPIPVPTKMLSRRQNFQ